MRPQSTSARQSRIWAHNLSLLPSYERSASIRASARVLLFSHNTSRGGPLSFERRGIKSFFADQTGTARSCVGAHFFQCSDLRLFAVPPSERASYSRSSGRTVRFIRDSIISVSLSDVHWRHLGESHPGCEINAVASAVCAPGRQFVRRSESLLPERIARLLGGWRRAHFFWRGTLGVRRLSICSTYQQTR